MPTDIVPPSGNASGFGYPVRLVAWSLGLFGLLRLPWVSAQVLLPSTQLQARAAEAIVGPSALPIEVTLACSGADALALCFAAILAYPATWRLRAAGIAAGAAGILVLNTLRIGTLGKAAASPFWFNALHVYIWPAALAIAISGLVLAWMLIADRRVAAFRPERAAGAEGSLIRFAVVAALFLLVFTLASPLYLADARVLAVADFVARGGAFTLGLLGMTATASAGVLTTPRGAFLVTQECISTPLIPVYLAAVLVYATTWPRRGLLIAAGVPLFVALGIARLLVVALPAGIGASPEFLIHAFSQLLVGAGMVGGVALWRHGPRPATVARVAAGLAIAVLFVEIFGARYASAIVSVTAASRPVEDPQGALTFLPVFQFGLFLALWTAAFVSSGWTRFLAGAGLLAVVQVVVAGGVGMLALQTGLTPRVPDIRAWALIGPAIVIAMVVNVARARR